MLRPAHRPSQRAHILATVIDAMANGVTSISLESAARTAGVTKAGLMYHFPTKKDLVTALVDEAADRWERNVSTHLAPEAGGAQPSARGRLAAYLRWAAEGEHNSSELLIFNDPRLTATMVQRWSKRLDAWLDLPDDLSAEDRGRLQAARMIADGCWFTDATDFLPIPLADRPELLRAALSLLEEMP